MQSTSSSSEKIMRRIEELIVDGSLQPGEKIPSERQLCNKLSASRPVVREAMKELRGRGVIHTQHGKGSFVSNFLENSNNPSTLNKVYQSHPRMLFDLLEVRELLEGEATKLAAERATEKDLHRITKAFNAMHGAYKNNAEVLDAAKLDHAFHRSIYEASHNPILIHTLQSIMEIMLNSVVVTVSNLYHRDRSKQQIEAYHRLIYNAIIDRKPENAERAAIDHIRDMRDQIIKIDREEQRLVRAQLLDEHK
jgi:DNA-binding FadR family transcriptional regulator